MPGTVSEREFRGEATPTLGGASETVLRGGATPMPETVSEREFRGEATPIPGEASETVLRVRCQRQ